MVCGHGSRNQNAAKEFAVIAEALRLPQSRYAGRIWLLEFCNPVISRGLDSLREQGVTPRVGRPRHALCRRPRQERHPVGAQPYQAQHKDFVINYGVSSAST